jgi:hypothetical protein
MAYTITARTTVNIKASHTGTQSQREPLQTSAIQECPFAQFVADHGFDVVLLHVEQLGSCPSPDVGKNKQRRNYSHASSVVHVAPSSFSDEEVGKCDVATCKATTSEHENAENNEQCFQTIRSENAHADSAIVKRENDFFVNSS